MNSDFSAIKWIIWDWNGTLLDDAHMCIGVMNQLLKKRALPLIDKAFYQAVFGFPVKDYYAKLGFDFKTEPFEVPALEFMDGYREALPDVALQPESIRVLEALKQLGYQQAMLSAMEQDLLLSLISRFGLIPYFEAVRGIDNHFGGGKVEAGRSLLDILHADPSACLLVGDTLHDFEVAQALHMRCILFSQGHHSAERLMKCGTVVIHSLPELVRVLGSNP